LWSKKPDHGPFSKGNAGFTYFIRLTTWKMRLETNTVSQGKGSDKCTLSEVLRMFWDLRMTMRAT